jgi:hypothetical protein
MRYKKGDRIYHYDYGLGVVLLDETDDILIEFDDYVSGHDGAGLGMNGHCRYCSSGKIEEVDEDYYDEKEEEYDDSDDYFGVETPLKPSACRRKADWTVSVQENSQQDIILLLL